MPFDDILDLAYTDDQGDEIPVGKGWLSLTREAYHEYRVSEDYGATLKDSQMPGANRSSPSSTSHQTHNPIAEFKKRIHHDALYFSVYKDKKQWDTWQQSTLAQVRAQDVAKVLNEMYTPTSPDDIALFAKKQEFMYTVFEHTF
jgi:hypothetical protein